MKKRFATLVFAILIVLSLGCSKKNGPPRIVIPKSAAKMAISFSWNDIPACGHASPEIRVEGAPAGTVQFQVRLADTKIPAWNHGGGKVANDGSGIIPAGALDQGYNGPCPPEGERHKYEFSVMAMDGNGEIIGFGKARQPFPPK